VLALGLCAADQALILGGNLRRLIAHKTKSPRAGVRVQVSRAEPAEELRDPWSGEMPG